MTEQEFRDSCAKFDISVLNRGYFLVCKWHDISFGHYDITRGLAIITDNLVKQKYYIMGRLFNLVNSDFEHTTIFVHIDKMEERFAYLIKTYKQDIINQRLKKLEYDFQ